MLKISEISDLEDLVRLKEEWCELLVRCPQATFFQHPDWLIPWWRTFGNGRLLAWVVRRGEKLVAIAPLFLHPWNNERQITLIGTGISDYLDVITDPDYTRDAMRCIYDQLQSQSRSWDLCDWQDLVPASPVLENPPRSLKHERVHADACVIVALPRNEEEWFGALPHGLRRNLRRYREHLESRGAVLFERYESDPEGALLRGLFDLHTRRWQLRGDDGMLSSESLFRFHLEASKNLSAHNSLRFYTMHVDGRMVAIIYGYRYGQTFYSYLGGFDPAFNSFSPGSLILQYAIRQAIREGVSRWDFLRGEETYKFDWGGVITPKHRVILRSPT